MDSKMEVDDNEAGTYLNDSHTQGKIHKWHTILSIFAATYTHTAAEARKFSRISSMSAMLHCDPSTHNPSPLRASHHPTSPAHPSSSP